MTSNREKYTLGDLFKKDIDKNEPVSWLFYCQVTFVKNAHRFLNTTKYPVFDFPPSSLDHHYTTYPRRFLSIVGDVFPVLADGHVMNDLFQAHWNQWIPQYTPPIIKSIDEGLTDRSKILTIGPMECIPDAKHFYEPNMHYDLQLKSYIPKIDVPSPRLMAKDEATFPCLIKADMTAGGKGNILASNKDELEKSIHFLVEELGWKWDYVIQEFLTGISKVLGYYFYLSKDKQITWLGIYEEAFENHFSWSGCFMDLDKQEELKKDAHQQFTQPLVNALNKAGYFGLVSYEIVLTQDGGRYMVDLNLRVTGSTTHCLIANTLSQLGFGKSRSSLGKQFDCSLEALVQKADQINDSTNGRVIIISGVDNGEGCKADYSVFGNSEDDLKIMLGKLGV